MKVRLSRRAERAIKRIDERWRAGADHPDVFLREVLDAITYLETVTSPGTPCPTSRRRRLKRLLLAKSKCHVYFETAEREDAIEVLTVWDGRRERPPQL